MRKTENAERESFRIWIISVVPTLAGQGAKDSIAGIISSSDGVPEIEEYMKEVLPNPEEIEIFKKELLEIVVDVTEFLLDAG